ncbi:MAG: cation-translocating P-type ATPase [Pirellulaceae bacterium]
MNRIPSTNWHLLTVDQTVDKLESCLINGLTEAEARQRIERFGRNQLESSPGRRPWQILAEQFKSSLVWLLVAAMAISLALFEWIDAGAIGAIILLNAVLGFWQDWRAERSLAALGKLVMPTVRVRRQNQIREIPVAELVPGDLVLLDSGYYVPADCRVVESVELGVNESALTGESVPVTKQSQPLTTTRLPLGDQSNRAFMGTMVVRGHSIGLVTSTGMQTELGQIAGSLKAVTPAMTPLQLRLARLSRVLAVAAGIIVGLLFLIGLAAGQSPHLMLMTALSLAVAIVPEGLPAVATVTLAVGAQRMFQQNALIRHLPAVETLGSVTVICSDKTGTLTQNRMTATHVDVAGHHWPVSELRPADESPDAVRLILTCAALCNDAELHRCADLPQEKQVLCRVGQQWVGIGEPTEAALVEVAVDFGWHRDELARLFPRTGEVPFESERKRMATLHDVRLPPNWNGPPWLRGAGQLVLVKGAADSVLSIASNLFVDDEVKPLDQKWRQRIQQSHDEMARNGTRVLAFGFRTVAAGDLIAVEQIEQEIVFVGLIGLKDPPRAEAKSAVAKCQAAGIRPVMITGDHPLTALSIARELGIADDQSILVGTQLSDMSDETLDRQVDQASVYARVAPQHKLRIVEALQRQGQVVAMTGDGVNDAPALKQSHIGVAMGRSGTDVAREAAEVVLLDDNFATIVKAVEQGRIVYDNVLKFVKYAMSGNVGEVLVMTVALLLGLPLPLMPLQVLWVNLVTDGLPGLALALEPAERNTMQRPPLQPDEPIFNRRMTRDVALIGLLIGIVSLGAGWVMAAERSVDYWRTIIFTVVTMSQMGNALACRSNQPLWQTRWTRNLWLPASVLLTLVLQVAVVYMPPLQTVFHTTSLYPGDFLMCLLISGGVLVLIELMKFLPNSRVDSVRIRPDGESV